MPSQLPTSSHLKPAGSPGSEAPGQESEARLSHFSLCEALPEPAWVIDQQSLEILATNAEATARYGFNRQEFLEMTMADLLPVQQQERFRKEISSATSSHSAATQWVHRLKNGNTIDVEIAWKALPTPGAVVVLSHDITERLRTENYAAVFADLGQRLSSARNPAEAAHSIVAAADALFGWDACLFDLCSEDGGWLTNVLSIDTLEGRRTEMQSTRPFLGPIAQTAIQQGPQLLHRSPTGGFPAGALPFGDTSRPSACIMAVPVRHGEKTLAVLSIQSYTTQAYNEDDLLALQALAAHCAGALERLRAETEIQRLHRELRGHLEELQTLFDVAPVGIAVAHDRECRTVSLNNACARVLGVTGLEMRLDGQTAADLPFRAFNGNAEISPANLPMRRAARDGTVVTGHEIDIVLGNGTRLNCFTCASPLYDEHSAIRGSLGVFVDLTERKKAEREILRLNAELEKRVRDRTTQLEAINKELEAFSYSVSHDLRAPLRSIRGFSEVLLERYQGVLDERGQEFLKRACESCVQMDKLIDDLLKLSRVGRSELLRKEVDLSSLAQSVIAELRKLAPDRAVDFRIAAGLKAQGDERLLRVALDNLLRNSWKFTRDQSNPSIEMGQTDDEERAFFIRDNGAGFDMAYASKLFGVFQRLHTASEFPGTGIGLATVQRIILRHGGRVWATGAVDKGATFYFTLPNDSQS